MQRVSSVQITIIIRIICLLSSTGCPQWWVPLILLESARVITTTHIAAITPHHAEHTQPWWKCLCTHQSEHLNMMKHTVCLRKHNKDRRQNLYGHNCSVDISKTHRIHKEWILISWFTSNINSYFCCYNQVNSCEEIWFYCTSLAWLVGSNGGARRPYRWHNPPQSALAPCWWQGWSGWKWYIEQKFVRDLTRW